MNTNKELQKILDSINPEDLKKILLIKLGGNEEQKTPKKRGRPKKEKNEIVDIPEIKKRKNKQENNKIEDPFFEIKSNKNASFLTGPRINQFEQNGMISQCKEDSKIDKLLNKNLKKPNKEISSRPKYQKISAKCTGCGKIEELDPSLVWRDFETREIVYKCQFCSRKQ